MQASPQTIQSELRRLKAEQPTLRMRDIAQTLGIAEATLVASACGEDSGTLRLSSDFGEQFAMLGTLGRVMALTRNEHAVIEKLGSYGAVEHSGHASQVIGADIDLRIFFHRFHSAFAVMSDSSRGPQRSLQFFDGRGDALHKVHLLPESDLAAYTRLVDRFAAADQSPLQLEAVSQGASEPARSEAEIEATLDVAALRTAFAQMQDTHEFFGLLRRFHLRRTQALRLLGVEAARPVDRLSLRSLLKAAATAALPIMIFVGNPGVIQIHSGPVKTLKQYGSWWNVMDPGFNLHLNETGITNAWVVRKPSSDGVVSSLELYDAAGESILYAFSKRRPGQLESEVWRALLQQLSNDPPAADSVEPLASRGVA